MESSGGEEKGAGGGGGGSVITISSSEPPVDVVVCDPPAAAAAPTKAVPPPASSRPRKTPKAKSVVTNNTAAKKRKASSKDNSSNANNKRPRQKTLVQHRKQRQKIAQDKERETEEGRRVAGDFFEVEKIIGYRKRKGKDEYLVRWRGKPVSDDSWEPSMYLCDSAHEDAKKFKRMREKLRKQSERDEELLGIRPKKPSKVMDLEETQDKALLESFQKNVLDKLIPVSREEWRSSLDSAQNALNKDFKFLDVERINVHEPDAKERVTHARIYGIPVVLTGHAGWPQFATRWLKNMPNEGSNAEGQPSSPPPPLDLSQPHELDIQKMIDDIGEERVPILKKNYDEYNPITREIFAKTFLEKCWPQDEASPSTTTDPPPPEVNNNRNNNKLYLHQWQFPRSDTALAKLCSEGSYIPLPNDILEEDLIQYWLERQGNPFQYIFMGNTDTMSKLHKDAGGLAITIAPIIGQKECILGHRDDGQDCLYNLESKLDNINLEQFPMTIFARVWKTIIKPGEILIMPQGTYHQCRNVTPCLSYHRFHLDTINVRAFLESMIAGDAPEVDQDDVLWNATSELMGRVDKHVSLVREGAAEEDKMSVTTPGAPANEQEKDKPDDAMSKTIHTLKLLRLVCQEVAILLERHRRNPKLSKNSKFIVKAADGEAHYWPRMVQDIDNTLHDYKYRHYKVPPKFKVKNSRVVMRKEESDDSSDDDDENILAEKQTTQKKTEAKPKSTTNLGELEKCLQERPQLQPFQEDLVISDSVHLREGDKVLVRLSSGKQAAEGNILAISDQARSVYVKYEDVPACFDEYQPIDCVKPDKDVPGPGEPSSSVPVSDEPGDGARTMQTVYCQIGGEGQFRRATVQSTKCATFYQIQLLLGKNVMNRWIRRDSIVDKMDKEVRKSPQQRSRNPSPHKTLVATDSLLQVQ